MQYNYEDINFVKRQAKIFDKDGNLVFNEEVEFPDFYDDNSVNIVASKYLYNSDKIKEISLKQLIDRVSNTIADWGHEQGYFENQEACENFRSKLKKYQIHQYFAFNSPVYFNLGARENPQVSACFILGIEDTMESITECLATESKIFKQGSGSGINFSNLRSSKEKISAGGNASGPVSFLKVMDVNASVIKSGGTLRRSAKMGILNIDHPDIEEFITCKLLEEKKLKALISAGIEPKKGNELSDEVFFQNTNISVRVSNEFMTAAKNNQSFHTKYVKTKENCKEYNAKELLMKIANNAWHYADPGIQYHDNVNEWNTCRKDGEITSSNPCSEYMFLNNSACNLASINLLKFYNDKNIDFEMFKDVVRICILAQDIVIDKAKYPTDKIKENSIKYRPLGLGYTNLGALLMVMGYPYDSDEGRNIASGMTALLTGYAYEMSNMIAEYKGSFERYEVNKDCFKEVMKKHRDEALKIDRWKFGNRIAEVWNNIVDKYDGFRNAQVTVLAPTGTTSFLMGATTTGMEPEFSHVKYKRLANSDGASIAIVNPLLERSLANLGYKKEDIESIKQDILNNKPFDEITNLKENHKAIFHTTMSKPAIPYMGHVKMMAAVQPFISGALSKTVNLPEDCTVNDIYDIYFKGWEMGLKGLTIYRDGSKNYQPLSVNNKESKPILSGRRKLPDERPAINHKFVINGNFKGYLSCGLYEDGSLGEIFVDVAKEGSTISGVLKSLAVVTSISLQYGVPLKDLIKKLSYQRFEPNGFTANDDIRICHSVVDYIFRYLGNKFLSEEDKKEIGLGNGDLKVARDSDGDAINGPPCNTCGSIMIRKGMCYMCNNCGNNEGSCG